MSNWRLAKSLEKLREQINAAAPTRSEASDGGIGNAEHASRVSDHNPWLKVNGIGVVTAYDFTHDPEHGVVGFALSRSLISDARAKYIIFNHEIWKARTRLWERYTGPNAHEHHVHISVTPDGADDVRPWLLPPLIGIVR